MIRAVKAFVRNYPLSGGDWGRIEDGLASMIFFVTNSKSKDALDCMDSIHERWAAVTHPVVCVCASVCVSVCSVSV